MEKKISADIKYLEEKKEEIKTFENMIELKKSEFQDSIEKQIKQFEETLKPLEDILTTKKNEFKQLGDTQITMSISELVEALAEVTNINVSDIKVKTSINFGYWGKWKPDTVRSLIKSKKPDCTFTKKTIAIKSTKINNVPFYIELLSDIDLDEIQADGKTLLEHCSIKKSYDDVQGCYYTMLVLDKNIESLNCTVTLKQFVDEKRNSYADLVFNKAILYCVKNKMNEEKQISKKKIRVKTFN